MSLAPPRGLLINRLRAAEQAKQLLLKELAEHYTPPYRWEQEHGSEPVDNPTSLRLYVGRRPAGHVWAGRAQLTKTPKITWEDSWFWRMTGQDTSTRCVTRAEGMAAVEAQVNANKLAYVDPRDFLDEPVAHEVPGG